MQCPVCQVELRMADRQGIEVDYCPRCRGVWLDRGELDKIIERSTQMAAPPEREQRQRDREDVANSGDSDYPRYPKGKRRRSFLSDLFDFD